MIANRKVLDLSQPIIVTMESFSHMKDAKLVSDDGSIFETTLINCDTISRNRTYYPLEDVVASMKDHRFMERLEQKVLYGECEHPCATGEEQLPLKRLMRVEPSRWSHRIDSYWVDGSDIKGTIQWAGPYGEHYRKLLVDHGSNFAMSIRAYTPNFIKKSDTKGDYVIKKHLMFIATFDVVTQPGLEYSRIMNPNKYSEITKNDKITINSNKTSISSKNSNNSIVLSNENFKEIHYTKAIDEIRDLAMSEEGVSIMSDLFGVDIESTKMAISGKNTLSVITEEGVRLDLPLSRTILSEVL